MTSRRRLGEPLPHQQADSHTGHQGLALPCCFSVHRCYCIPASPRGRSPHIALDAMGYQSQTGRRLPITYRPQVGESLKRYEVLKVRCQPSSPPSWPVPLLTTRTLRIAGVKAKAKVDEVAGILGQIRHNGQDKQDIPGRKTSLKCPEAAHMSY